MGGRDREWYDKLSITFDEHDTPECFYMMMKLSIKHKMWFMNLNKKTHLTVNQTMYSKGIGNILFIWK